ncbi:NADH-quinone oxidoreductase subunit N [Fulvivirgaceae bacterium PWU5]|uniref:NADH-quinone oxidoreductase subunit N n=1 Tax=Dawidia cretensis TaxID=2782350 RepID=A0AAP2DZ14_9BACT|nr:NADH-quinone oxidoreductase subunit N [Dawidia cretensis]MBT1710240.1 NADH-quinone oxidoreductase subunit N [Dawidia cretensis]
MNALLVICGLSIVSLLAEIANFKKWLTAIAILGLLAATATLALEWDGEVRTYFSHMLMFDNVALAFTGLISVVSILWFWMASDYFQAQPQHRTERTSLVIFAIVGAILMASYNNMAMLFLGIEILSLSLYVLAGSNKESLLSIEAAFKYFLMGSFATGFLLMGIALLYGATGSFDIGTIAVFITEHSHALPAFFYAGVLLLLVGLAFKISAVPFHFWAPDVYGGAPTTVTAFMSTVVKIGALAAFYRMFSIGLVGTYSTWSTILMVITVLTLVLPNITAVYQSHVKRILAYSSVGHVGYILLAFTADPTASSGVIYYYLASYAVASIAAFSVLYLVEGNSESITIEYFNGLFKRNPLLAVGLTIALLSLAGIPPFPGFFGKYMVFALAIAKGYTPLVIVAVVTSLIGVYYYFRIIIAMYFQAPQQATALPVSGSQRALTFVLIALSFALGIFPDAVLSLIQ